MIRFALIGCGRIAVRHVAQIKRIGKLAAVCDTDKIKAERLATDGAAVYTQVDDLLRQEKAVDVVVICTPNGLHAEHIIRALQARKHVLCEKPMCLTSAAAWQIIETEKFCRRKLFVVKSARFNPLLQRLNELIKNNSLGKLYSFQLNCLWSRPPHYYHDWHGKTFPDGGSLYTQFSHYIDALIWLFGMPQAISGYSANIAHEGIMEFEDTGVASVLMQNGMLGSVNWSVNAYEKNCAISLSLLAEKATIILGGEYLYEVQYQQPNHLFYTKEIPGNANSANNHRETMSHHEEIYNALADALQNRESLIGSSFDGLQTVAFIESMYRAVRQ